MTTAPDVSPALSKSFEAQVLSLPESERQQLATLLTPKTNEWIRQAPTETQTAFLLLNCREALYGGAAGGGKSSALLSAALQYVDVPGYSAVLFRRTYQDLARPGALMDRAREWLAPTAARFNEQKHQWRFPSGATLSFAHMELEKDKYDHQGAEYQFIGFDELTQFAETQYRYLHSRLRRIKGHKVPLRVRAASNPGGAGHDWVFRRFFTEEPKRPRIFISAKLEDNPHLDRAEYELSLNELDPVTRRQLRNGDWKVRVAGEMFKREWFEVIDAVPAHQKLRVVRWWDMAATDPNEIRNGKRRGGDPDFTSGVKVGEARGIYYVLHVKRLRGTPAKVEDTIGQTAADDGYEVPVWLGEERGSAGKNLVSSYARNVLKGYVVHGHRETGDKSVRAGPASSAAEKGHIKVVRGVWNQDFFDELEAFPTEGVHDDQVDGLSGCFIALRGGNTSGVSETPTEPTRVGAFHAVEL